MRRVRRARVPAKSWTPLSLYPISSGGALLFDYRVQVLTIRVWLSRRSSAQLEHTHAESYCAERAEHGKLRLAKDGFVSLSLCVSVCRCPVSTASFDLRTSTTGFFSASSDQSEGRISTERVDVPEYGVALGDLDCVNVRAMNNSP